MPEGPISSLGVATAAPPASASLPPRRGSSGSTSPGANPRALCDKPLQGRYDLEVVDIYQHPQLAKDEQIIAAPTPIRKLPLPLRRIVGGLSDEERVLFGLDLRVRQDG